MRGKKYNNLKLNIASNTFWNVKWYMSRISVLLTALLILRLCSLTKNKVTKKRSPRYSEITLNLDNNVTFSPQSHFRLSDYLFYTFRLLVTLCTVDSMISW
jgi:hypothetical protein